VHGDSETRYRHAHGDVETGHGRVQIRGHGRTHGHVGRAPAWLRRYISRRGHKRVHDDAEIGAHALSRASGPLD